MEERQTESRRVGVWLRLGVRLAGLCLAVVLARLLVPVLSVLLPFFGALGVAAALNPLIRRLQRKLGWSRRLLSLLVVLSVLTLAGGVLALLVYALGREAAVLAGRWEELSAQLLRPDAWLSRLGKILPAELMELVNVLSAQLGGWVRESVSALLSSSARRAAGMAAGLPGVLLGLAVFLMASYFLTADYPYLRTRVIQSVSEDTLRMLGQLRRVAAAATGGYLKAQLFLSAGVFVLLLGGLLLWGQEYALLLALGLAVLDFIPLIGAGVVLVPWAAASVWMGRYTDGLWAAALLGVTALFRRLAEPRVVGGQTGLSPVLSLLSIYVGMRLAGVLGMILGPILTLMVLNLAGLGVFHGLYEDIHVAAEELVRLFRRE